MTAPGQASAILAAYRACGATAAMVLAHYLARGATSQIDVATDLATTDRTVRTAIEALRSAGMATVARGMIVATGSQLPETGSQFPQYGNTLPESGSHDPEYGSQLPDRGFPHTGTHDAHTRDPARARVRVGVRASVKGGDQSTLEIGAKNQSAPNDLETINATPTGGAIPSDTIEKIQKRAPARTTRATHDRKPRAKSPPKPPTCGTAVIAEYSACYVRRYGARPSAIGDRAANIHRLAKGLDPELAPGIVAAFFRDEWVASQRHGFALLASAGVWDRCLADALQAMPWHRPPPDPTTCDAATVQAWIDALPAAPLSRFQAWLSNIVWWQPEKKTLGDKAPWVQRAPPKITRQLEVAVAILAEWRAETIEWQTAQANKAKEQAT